MSSRKKIHPLIKELVERAHNHPQRLQEAKRQGKRIVQYTGSFIPEALIYAAGAEPHLMHRWEGTDVSEAQLTSIRQLLSQESSPSDWHTQLGFDPVTPIADLIITQQTDCHVGRMTELLEYLKLPIYKVGVPSDWKMPFASAYYYKALTSLKKKLEALSGHPIEQNDLQHWIDMLNNVKEGLSRVASLRKRENPPLSGVEFLQLNHATLYVDPQRAIDTLHTLYGDLEQKEGLFAPTTPRLLLAGHVLEFGEKLVPVTLEQHGVVIVAEMLDEGVRHFQWRDELEGDLIKNLGEARYFKKIPPTIFQPAWRERFAYMARLIQDYRIDGIVWHQRDRDEIYDMESLCITKWLTGLQIPMLKLETAANMSADMQKVMKTNMMMFVSHLKGEKNEC